MLELPSIPIVFIPLVIKLELFMLQLTCEKYVGMGGLCMFNFVILLSLHLVSVFLVLPSLHLLTFFENHFFVLVSVYFFLIK